MSDKAFTGDIVPGREYILRDGTQIRVTSNRPCVSGPEWNVGYDRMCVANESTLRGEVVEQAHPDEHYGTADVGVIDFDGLQTVAEAATPGPWQWRWRGNDGPDLVAAHSGMLYVMGFARLGMNYAQPTFAEREKKNGRWTGGLMRKFTEWCKRDDKLAPDARFIAAFDPSTALALLALARRAVDAEAEAARLREENAASARALESAIKWFVAPCRTRIGKVIGWRCGCWVDLDTPPPCPRESVPHIPECPVPRMEAALAQAKGGTK